MEGLEGKRPKRWMEIERELRKHETALQWGGTCKEKKKWIEG